MEMTNLGYIEKKLKEGKKEILFQKLSSLTTTTRGNSFPWVLLFTIYPVEKRLKEWVDDNFMETGTSVTMSCSGRLGVFVRPKSFTKVWCNESRRLE
jgi:hypothetical protein